ncbi:MAG TPA: ABC transporter ATP-binding protein/permease [Microvirga sp.]|nr:ABC transporter ATP-binding protein/permease [Microvirga sp.]
MAESTAQEAASRAAGPGPLPSLVARRYFRLASGFWSGPTRRKAWLLTLGVLAFVVANLLAALGVNRWNRFFFDMLEQKNTSGVMLGIGLAAALVLGSALAFVGLVQMRMRLQLRWRQWLTGKLIAEWLAERRFYQLNIVTGGNDNPEYRIADDVRMAVEPLVEFIVGLTNALLAALAFLGVLWAVGGALRLGSVTIPGYMVFGAILYSSITSLAMVVLGRPLIQRVEVKNAGEARLRYELTRVRDSAENIALIGGDDDERAHLNETFGDLAERWVKVIVQQARMSFVSNANLVLSPIVPLLLGAPKYLAGELSLGELMQAATAFTQVQIALNWLVDNAIRLAEWLASAQRVVELKAALEMLDQTIGSGSTEETIVLGDSPDDALHLRNLSITQQNGRLMIQGADAVIRRGEKVLVKGESGTGKSTLIRAMAGLWPWGSGQILRPRGARIAFLPQQPYIPLGTLRHALLYPASDREASDAELAEVLRRCGLSHLVPRLDEEDQWTAILSGGEKQRLAFARLLLRPPDIAILDEATSALDEVSQARMMSFLQEDLAHTTVLNVAHRPGLEEYHDGELHLVRVEAGHAVTQDHHYPRLKKLWHGILGGSGAWKR